MCGTFVQTASLQDILDTFDIQHIENESAVSYNIKPTQPISIITFEHQKLTLRRARWWLIPSWAQSYCSFDRTLPSTWSVTCKKMILHFNSRLDTITNTQRPYWKKLVTSQRCLIVSTGFVEWPDDALRDPFKPKTPHFSLSKTSPYLPWLGCSIQLQHPTNQLFFPPILLLSIQTQCSKTSLITVCRLYWRPKLHTRFY